ncbi:MAG: hypothetical protein GX601_18020 [Anaerolineales bacterium]|nr:hypothetical protein [Anaerolineales bacterium]
MAPLAVDLRNQLEKAVVAARQIGEAAAQAVLVALGVAQEVANPSISPADRELRVLLRARARQLGGGQMAAGLPLLCEEIAYNHWHRLFFARFLAENGLLMHPNGAPVTLDECAELARAELARAEGRIDGWDLAARYAAGMLPGIFGTEDPAGRVRLAPESRQALQSLVQGLPTAVFTSDDGLGWVYQFWQSEKKQEVNASERKIGGADIAPVTQLFTEDYMVRFLLENTLGAWWAARHPRSPLLKDWEYLRFLDDGTPAARRPAAGTFPGWPEHVREVTMLDPCGGSGHFVVAAFEMLWRMRAEEEGLTPAEAGERVLQENVFCLEIDPRCTQIAAFALLLAAWKAGGYRPLTMPNVACSGIAVEGQLSDWLKLANGDLKQRTTLERLYNLFRQAPTLGSLIDPTHVPLSERMFSAEYDEVLPVLERALKSEKGNDPVARLTGQAAQGVARAARLLARRYTLVATNVPYLGLGRQQDDLRTYSEQRYPLGKADLATVFLERCRDYSVDGGTYALVLPQGWTFLGSYQRLREMMLNRQTWNQLCQLGPRAFEMVSGEVVNVVLALFTNAVPAAGHQLTGVEADEAPTPKDKAHILREGPMCGVTQEEQLANPDARISLHPHASVGLLSTLATGYAGICSGDYPRFGRCFWELSAIQDGWSPQQSTVRRTVTYGGREHAFFWEEGHGQFYRSVCDRLGESQVRAWIRGTEFAGQSGVAVSSMSSLPCTLYNGDLFDNNTAVILPADPVHLPAIWAYCSSPEFSRDVRRIDRSLKVTNSVVVKVPFDLERWQRVADEQYPDGLPAPYSNDPTQWLFKGNPVGSAAPLQVAVARLLGYRWPDQEPDVLDPLVDRDGIVALSAIAGERPAAERLRALLATAYGPDWSPEVQTRLLAEVGAGPDELDVWLRDAFFAQHCRLFHNRPFIWHVWDGRKDGFAALVNYHRLDNATLNKLIYTALGQWITQQQSERDRGVAGADGRLVAAQALQQKLIAIREGEPPYDIYVRWKPLAQQPIGWDPDLNDGVRLNIRPWVTAGVLRAKFSVSWKKDRGKDPDGGERLNDRHYTNAEKRTAREKA